MASTADFSLKHNRRVFEQAEEMDRQTSSSGSEGNNFELRIILLGFKQTGKSSSGNTILGSNEFDLKEYGECVKKQGMVSGRQVSVIETPGRRHQGTRAALVTPRLCLQEAVRSVTLCPPGPHVLLLVIKSTGSFSEEDRETVVEYLKLFGETVWNHIIVLFTHGDQLEDKDIQQHIECEGVPLQWVLERCGNRFHVFNNETKGDSTQVAELLKKIDEMVAGNHGNHFEVDKERLSWIAQKQREYEESKRNKEQQDRENLEFHSLMGDEHKLTEQRIVLLGQENAGKSSVADNILDSESDMETTFLSTSRQATVGRWQVTVVDTPGWLWNAPRRETPKRSKLEIVRSVSLCSPGPQAFLLVIPANLSFTEADEVAINEHLELLGEEVWIHTIVVFTRASWMGDTPMELYITSEGDPLNRILKKCANRYHVISNMSDDRNQIKTLLEKIEVMVAGNSNCCYQQDKRSQKDMAEGDEYGNEDSKGATSKLPCDNREEASEQQGRKWDTSTTDGSSGYATLLSECGTTNSAQKEQPNF